MKRLFSTVSLFILALSMLAQGKAKYVFYFIGDGMGVNHVNAAEYYLGSLEGRLGTSPLCFGNFPYTAFVTTHSASSDVTDSAAAGTAMSTGHKTNNGRLGMSPDKSTSYTSVAKWAQEAGAAVGVTTSVSPDHATPAAFYANVPDRNMYYEIGVQMTQTGYDFFAGADFLKPENPNGGPDLYAQCATAGYTIARGYKDYQKKQKKADKMVLLQPESCSQRDRSEIAYAIDREKDDMTLTEITRAAINFLTKKQSEKNGFFLMVEGGKIDHAAHANDATAVITETIDMDEAVKVAYEFYEQHPEETLIIVAADHETGGMSLGRGAYETHMDQLRYQRMTIHKMGIELRKLHKTYGDKYNVDVVKEFLKENFGYGAGIKLSDSQNKRIEEAFAHIQAGIGKDDKSWYQNDDELASVVKRIMSEQGHVGWTSGAHTGGYVPVFAIGAGAELFTGRIDNTDIPKRVAQAAGWTVR